MGWSYGFDSNWDRPIGYSVVAWCDHPACFQVIDRGLYYVCGGEPYGGEHGCGLFFCSEHLWMGGARQQCERCTEDREPFAPSGEHAQPKEERSEMPF